MDKKPLYRVKLDDGYYATGVAWSSITKDKASTFTHKKVRLIRDKIKGLRMGFVCSIEKV